MGKLKEGQGGESKRLIKPAASRRQLRINEKKEGKENVQAVVKKKFLSNKPIKHQNLAFALIVLVAEGPEEVGWADWGSPGGLLLQAA